MFIILVLLRGWPLVSLIGLWYSHFSVLLALTAGTEVTAGTRGLGAEHLGSRCGIVNEGAGAC
jgi:hypothetical protein